MRLSANPNVIYEELEGQAVLLQLDEGVYYKLNGSGSRIWTLIQEERDVTEIQEILEREFDADAATISRDIDDLVTELETRGLIVVERP